MTGLRFRSEDAETAEAIMLEPILAALSEHGLAIDSRHGRRPFWVLARTPAWALGPRTAGARLGTVLIAPTADDVMQVRQSWPKTPVLIAESFDPNLRQLFSSSTISLPRITPASFYPLSSQEADVFGATARLHLHERPRLVYLGGYYDGAALTRLFGLAKHLLSRQGELVLMHGLERRASLAPAIQHLRLSERAIFAPPLSTSEAAGVLLGADAILAASRMDGRTRVLGSWAVASGIPIVAEDSPHNRALFGPAALFVYASSEQKWTDAVTQALTSRALREELARRQFQATEAWHMEVAMSAWIDHLLAGYGSQNPDNRLPAGWAGLE